MSQFSQQLAFGKIGEGRIATWLRKSKGYNVLPVYEKEIHEGKGPTLFTLREQVIAPDLFCFRAPTLIGNDILWIEAKTKSAFTWHRITGQWTTGIDIRHYHDYLKVAALSIFPVWLLFLHLDGTAKDTPSGMKSPTGLFGNEITYLAAHEHHRHDNWGRSGMVYWDRMALIKIENLESVLEVAHV